MRSSNEMYERGVTDAEQNDLNLFYYQHYYHYRKGYDKARRRVKRSLQDSGTFSRSLLLIVASSIVLGLLIAFVGTGRLEIPSVSLFNPMNNASAVSPTSTPTATQQVTPTPNVTATITPTATMTPTPEPTLQVGGQAQVVNVGDAALVGRSEPGIVQPDQTRFPEGTQVTILDGPIEADGYRWWLLQDANNNSGWSAERSLEDVTWLQPIP